MPRFIAEPNLDPVCPGASQLELRHFRRAPQFAPRSHRFRQQMLIERRPIDLKPGKPRIIARPKLDALLELRLRPGREPHPQSLLGELMMPEIRRKSEDTRQKT